MVDIVKIASEVASFANALTEIASIVSQELTALHPSAKSNIQSNIDKAQTAAATLAQLAAVTAAVEQAATAAPAASAAQGPVHPVS